ncbi:MAG: site-specific integrase, partial [bacterium]|nr:site-specific integrase [bacterium]
MTIERGLASNTVSAYTRDLARYESWCSDRGISAIDAVTQNDVADFGASLRRETPERAALSASSAARAVVSVRSFHRFVAREGMTTTDPARDVSPPT